MEVIKINAWLIWFIIIICCIIIPRRNRMYFNILRRKKEGRKTKMPTELMKEFIGKVCAISLFNDSFGITAKIVCVEGNWLKVEEKDTSRILNGDMIRDIKIMPAKYQK